MQRVTAQRVTVSATNHSATGDYLSSLNKERRHISGSRTTGNLLRPIQGYICNIFRVARTVEIENYLTEPNEIFGTRVTDMKLK